MLSKSGPASRHKNRQEVVLTLAGQAPMNAVVFLTLNERLIDLLNDQRAFIPVAKPNGETIIVAKSQIVSIIEGQCDEELVEDAPVESPDEAEEEAAEPKPSARKTFDPYAALRITPDASLDEIRAAYKARIKAVHPDAVAGLDLDEDLARAALQATQRVNYAYKKILAEGEDIKRGASHDDDEDAA